VDTVLVASAQQIHAATIHRVQNPVLLHKVLLAIVGTQESVPPATIVLKVLVKNVDQTRKALTRTNDALLVLSDGKMLLLLAHHLLQKEISAQVCPKKVFCSRFFFVFFVKVMSKSCQSHVKVMRCIHFYTSYLTFRGCFLANCSFLAQQVLTKMMGIRAQQWITPSAAERSAPMCTPIATLWIRP
jgi:hypothetical protein